MQTYFDNAATSFPKPNVVIEAMVKYQQFCGASPGRGTYPEATDASDVLELCRYKLSELVHATKPNHCIFTLNCSDALNLAILGIASHHRVLHEQVHIVTTAMDHNSVIRPLHALEHQGVENTIVKADSITGIVNPEDIASAIKPHTRLVIVAHGSNVTGTVQDIASIGRVCNKIPFLVDAAQTMGHTHIDVQEMNIDLLAFPGHKGLLGPLGTGGLIMREDMDRFISPIRFGGTGSASEYPYQPIELPYKYETGSHNMVGICGLLAAIEWILSTGVDVIHEHEMSLCEQFIEGLSEVRDVQIVGPQTSEHRCGVFSLRFDERPETAAEQLEMAGIKCRPGLHCAPYAHKTLGTDKFGGTVRVSFGPFHTQEDVSSLVRQIAHCSQKVLL